jgi:hypothetical protein
MKNHLDKKPDPPTQYGLNWVCDSKQRLALVGLS